MTGSGIGKSPTEMDRATFRQVCGSFVTGVTAITTGRDGLTASSFTSLSLEPPLILVCLDLKSVTLPAVEDCASFAVNILSDDQEDISRKLASPGRHDLVDIPTRIGQLGIPLIEGCLAQLECRLRQKYEEGDHVILVGSVEHGLTSDVGKPLAYFRGAYRHLE
jgi:flavin reductase (DIM6/NTAB) family NADH-FMN oxidoreductase RutF